MKLLYIFLALSFFVAPFKGNAQTTINTYARVTAMSGTTLTISNSTGTFVSGQAILMQMKDSVIGASTSNNSSFGSIDNIRSAGKYEVVGISAVSGTTVTLSGAPVNTYNLSVNARVQLISYPTLGGSTYTLSSSLTALAWNGNVGGIVAFKVNGTLILNNNISVDGQGFKGGNVGVNAPSDYACDPNTYYDNAGGVSTTYYGGKGEGIYVNSTAYTVARGQLANGGGGGNLDNAGGGGGSNFTTGGTGGFGWTCTASSNGGGLGGADLSSYIGTTRFFMGGGGGGGQQNNAVGTAGANGGGIVMIKATTVQTNSGCTGGAITISAQGANASNSGNDGAGGGGAGGTVLVDAGIYSINNACPLNILTSGGSGGTVNNSGSHGGGGGGGKGIAILAQQITVPANVTTVANSGTGGGNSTATGTTTAASGNTTAVTGGTTNVLYAGTSPLPVTLVDFNVSNDNKMAVLYWSTAIELNFSHFEIERSLGNANDFISIGTVNAKGNNSSYHFKDDLSFITNAAIVYYRLKMVDIDGGVQYSDIVVLRMGTNTLSAKAFPVPAQSFVNISMNAPAGISNLQVYISDMQGRVIKNVGAVNITAGQTVAVSLEGLTAGQYIVVMGNGQYKDRVVIVKI